MWMGTVNMNFFIISLARIELHSCAPLRPACFGALPSSRLGCALSGDGERGEAPGRPGPALPAGGGVRPAPGAAAASATRNLANFLRPLAPGRRAIRLPGLPQRQLSEGQELLGAAI